MGLFIFTKNTFFCCFSLVKKNEYVIDIGV